MNFQLKLVSLAVAMSASSFAADTLKIALTGPFSGGSAPMGVSTRDGAKLAVQEINAAGGVKVGAKKKCRLKWSSAMTKPRTSAARW